MNEKEEDGTKELWAELKKIGVEDDSLLRVYLFLHNNPPALKAFNGVPIDQRKQLLAMTVTNYAPQGSVRNVSKLHFSSYFYSSYNFSYIYHV